MSLGMFSQGHMWLRVGISLWGVCLYLYVCFPTGVGQHNLQNIRHLHTVSRLQHFLLLCGGWMLFKGCWYSHGLAFSFSVFSCLFSVLPCPVLLFFLRCDPLACPDRFHLVLVTLPHLLYHSLKCVFSLFLAACCMCMSKLALLLCVSGTDCDQHTQTHTGHSAVLLFSTNNPTSSNRGDFMLLWLVGMLHTNSSRPKPSPQRLTKHHYSSTERTSEAEYKL